jgi:hypothetical protein
VSDAKPDDQRIKNWELIKKWTEENKVNFYDELDDYCLNDCTDIYDLVVMARCEAIKEIESFFNDAIAPLQEEVNEICEINKHSFNWFKNKMNKKLKELGQ